MNRLGYVNRVLCVGKSSGITYNRVIILGSFAGSFLATRANKGMKNDLILGSPRNEAFTNN